MSETTETQTPTPAPAPKPEPKPYHVEKSTIEEKVINPMRPDFNASAQSAYLGGSEKLQGEEKYKEDGEGQQDGSDEVDNGEAGSGEVENSEDNQENQNGEQVSQSDKPNRQEKISKYLADMAKKQAQLRRKEKELEQKTKEKTGVDINDLKNRAKEDPLGVLEEIGLNYNDVTKRIISGKDSEEKRQLQKALDRLDELQKTIEQRDQEAQQREASQKIESYKTQLRDHITAKASDYELINATQSYDAVYDTIRQYYEQTDRILTFDEAANVVENELEKQELSRLEAILKTNKAKKWGLKRQEGESQDLVNASQKAEGTEPPARESRPVSTGAQKTITGEMVATTPMQRRRRMSRDESVAEAAKLIRFNQP